MSRKRSMTTMVALAVVIGAVPVGSAGQEPELRLTGQVRPRTEWRGTPEWDDAFTTLRSRLGVDVALNERVSAVVQLQDSRLFGEENSTRDASAGGLDMHQAFVEARWGERYPVRLRMGRQEVGLGNERLLGHRDWTVTGQAFDGVRLDVGDAAGLALTALAATTAERGREIPYIDDTGDGSLLALFVAAHQVQVYYIQDIGASYRVFDRVNRATLATRLVLPDGGALDGSLEIAYQLGTQYRISGGQEDIGAFMLAGRIGRRMGRVLRRLTLGVDWLSGDDNPTNNEHTSFNLLYGSRHRFFGAMDWFSQPDARTGDRGLIDVLVASEISARGQPLALDIHGFFSAVERPLEQTDIGWELDLGAPFTIAGALDIRTGYSLFLSRPLAAPLGLGPDPELSHWLFLQATASF